MIWTNPIPLLNLKAEMLGMIAARAVMEVVEIVDQGRAVMVEVAALVEIVDPVHAAAQAEAALQEARREGIGHRVLRGIVVPLLVVAIAHRVIVAPQVVPIPDRAVMVEVDQAKASVRSADQTGQTARRCMNWSISSYRQILRVWRQWRSRSR